MQTGEISALGVAVCWTLSALFFEKAGNRIGSLAVNIIRLAMAIVLLGIGTLITRGMFLPFDATPQQWFWLSLSGFIGFFLGDLCLFYSYTQIGSRMAQLVMTLAHSPDRIYLFGGTTGIFSDCGYHHHGGRNCTCHDGQGKRRETQFQSAFERIFICSWRSHWPGTWTDYQQERNRQLRRNGSNTNTGFHRRLVLFLISHLSEKMAYHPKRI